ncbi:AAA family ATPase [Agrobacterium sp. SORGH_AS_0440]|uniref:AAA family ATPase n=1 Tax=Agrobacterium sp. SORGH_AS_0440 TaxID=3041757 RepID=UPI0027825DE6|nr:AAA family ATPase [Agrobacterium sp. SORGH_AS_0440]MDP9729947.1 hypothetical protein [Rhizobium sp. SORGH_AS_0285]MDR6080976.1 hypothetical protein [Agrobacterium sp. SORGH_AS_0440]
MKPNSDISWAQVLRLHCWAPAKSATILSLNIGETRSSIYLDLESEADRAKLSEPALYLASHGDKLVILDEVYRLPNVFQTLRGLIDRNRRRTAHRPVGSASIDLLKQSGETLAGRIAYLEMQPAAEHGLRPGALLGGNRCTNVHGDGIKHESIAACSCKGPYTLNACNFDAILRQYLW